MRHLEKPEIGYIVVDKKKVKVNIRESRLFYMFNRNLISLPEYEAGSRYRRMCEFSEMGVGGGLSDVRVDGSKPDFLASHLGAVLELVDIAKDIGPRNTKIMKMFCWQNFSIIEIAANIERSERRTSNYVHEGLQALCIYYGYTKVRNTIKGQGTKAKRQKIS